MAHPITLPTMGVLALLGAVGGVHLGRSAIAEINPVHFKWKEKGSSFYADLTPNRSFDSQPRTITEEAAPALGSGCVGCTTYPEEYFPIHDPAVDGFETVQSASIEAIPLHLAAQAQDLPEESARRMADQALVGLYAHAPTTADEQLVHARAQQEVTGEAENEAVLLTGEMEP